MPLPSCAQSTASGPRTVSYTHLDVYKRQGKSHLTASLSSLDRGKAHFTLKGLNATQLEAGNRLYDVTAGHIRALFGGEVGGTLQYLSLIHI